MNLIEDLLTENRFWTFWSSDWSKKIYVFWGGETNFKIITNELSDLLGLDMKYERQVSIKTPDKIYR